MLHYHILWRISMVDRRPEEMDFLGRSSEDRGPSKNLLVQHDHDKEIISNETIILRRTFIYSLLERFVYHNMRDIPECLNRRYRALDDLIRDLTSAMNDGSSERQTCANNSGLKLMCDFWNILKDNPDCNLPEEVINRMGVEGERSNAFGNQSYDCYLASKEPSLCGEDSKKDAANRIRHVNCCNRNNDQGRQPSSKKFTCNSKTISKTPSIASDKVPLSKVLCNLKEAMSFDKKCGARVAELISAQQELTDQIQNLEEREKAGAQLLKQADCMWSSMEDTYKQKVAESIERQNALMKQLHQIEISANKWRKNKKDLEFQIMSINKSHEEINEKINQKINDIKVMDMEIQDLKRRIESNVKDTDTSKNSLKKKKEASDGRMVSIAGALSKLQKKITEEQKTKLEKEQEGTKYVKDAREDLQKICRVLLQKRLENEDLKAEKEALIQEIEILTNAADTCKEKCKEKEIDLKEEIKRINEEIAQQKIKSQKCHECVDTTDVRKFCTDCPRCLKERNCLIKEDHCCVDTTMDCVCMSVKQKFLDNVFENMYTVLEKQAQTNPGKAVAESVLNCLKRSKNGKLNGDTRKILQEFILSTVKKNLNLTIVGGAVKTRCEMEPETYKQLMLCLKDVQVTKPSKEDKGTEAKKAPCNRWGGVSECQCPKGPKACICTKKAPQPTKDHGPCGPPDPEDAGEVKICPHKEAIPCGPECGMQGGPQAKAGIDVAAWRPDPCHAQNCHFAKNMRAAQCVLGPEALANTPKAHPTPPIIPHMPVPDDNMAECNCGEKALKPCPCHGDRRSQPRQRIIEEVLGRYDEVLPIEKVISVAVPSYGESNSLRRINTGCNCSNLPLKYLLASNISDNKITQFCACSSNYVPRDSLMPYIDKMRKKGHLNICQSSKNCKTALENGTLRSKDGHDTSQQNKSDNDIKVILCPKFPYSYDDKIGLSLGICNILSSESTQMRLKSNSSSKISGELNSCDASFVGRKVCETVKNLMKDILVPDIPNKHNVSTSDVEWVTLESLYKEITSLTKLKGSSSDSANEVEVKCETLEASKDFRLIHEKVYGIKSVHMSSNLIETQRSIGNQLEVTNDLVEVPTTTTIYKNKQRFTTIAEELKSKLLEDIRGTYEIVDVKLSLDSIKSVEPTLDTKKFKNIRKCLNNLGDVTLESNECKCKYTQNRKRYDGNQINRKYKRDWRHEKAVDMKQSYPSSYSYIKYGERRIPKESNKNTKHVKANLKDNCDKSTCAEFGKHAIDNDPHIKPLKDVSTELAGNVVSIPVPIPSVQNDVLFRGENQEQFMSNEILKENLSGEKIAKYQFKIPDIIEISHPKDQFAELTLSKSGTLVMELDQQIIESIEKKTQKDPNLFVSVKKTDSGNILIDFDAKENEVETYKVKLRISPSGTKLLDMHKDMVGMLKNTIKIDKQPSPIQSIKLSLSPKKQDSPNLVSTVNNSSPVNSNNLMSTKHYGKDISDADNNYSPTLNSTIIDDLRYESKNGETVVSMEGKKMVNAGSNSSTVDTNNLRSPKHVGSNQVDTNNTLTTQNSLVSKKLVEAVDASQIVDSENLVKSKYFKGKYKFIPLDKCTNCAECDECKDIYIHDDSSVLDKIEKTDSPLTLSWKSGEKFITEKDCACVGHRLEDKNIRAMGPPIEFKWEPEIPKPEYDCVCSRTDPTLMCTIPSSITAKIKVRECACPLDSETDNNWKSEIVNYYDYESELKEFYEQGNVSINVKIRGQNGKVRKLVSVVTRTPSETIAIYSRIMPALENIPSDDGEHPVLLSKTASGTYFISIGCQYDVTLNAVLRKTPSGGMLLIPKSKLILDQTRDKPRLKEYLKIKVNGVRNYPVELPAVLKTTPSDNYMIVLDKEFEKRYRKSVNEFIADKGECVIDLNITNSGHCIIDLDMENENNPIKGNALLVKSLSGNIKILVHGPVFESMAPMISKKSSSSSAKAFRQLLSKLPVSSREIHRENLRKSKFLDKKASSDTELYEKVRVKLNENKKLLSEPSAVLKRTESGRYAIILDKESKKAFIHNLQSYLTVNAQGLVPIKRTDSGEIIISLNNNKAKEQYGSLKITSSGNMYVVVNEETLKDMTKKPENKKTIENNESNTSTVQIKPKNVADEFTDPINNSVNKAVTTTCNAKPDDCDCEPIKCVCAELEQNEMDWFEDRTFCSEHERYYKKKPISYMENIPQQNSSKDDTPHIVIKPACDCQFPTKAKFRDTEKCYFMLDSVCPYHKDRYDGLSNELLEISGLCNKAQSKLKMNKLEFVANSGPKIGKVQQEWGSLSYLPPQLPPFLGTVYLN